MVSTLGTSAAFLCPSARRWVLLCSGLLVSPLCFSPVLPVPVTAHPEAPPQSKQSAATITATTRTVPRLGPQEVSEVTLWAGACRAAHLPTAGQKLAESARIGSQENPALGLCSWPSAEPRYLCHDQHTHIFTSSLCWVQTPSHSHGVLPRQSFIAVRTVDVCGLGFVAFFF